MPSNIHPIYDQMISRSMREQRLKQHSKVIWFTGLSGSGKSTIATALERKLFEHHFFAQILDGDNIRHGINSNLGFSVADRHENIRRIAEIAKLYVHSGVITLCSFISPTREIRAMAKQIVGAPDFMEIFIDTPLHVCEERDVKGLYVKARAGEITNFTGIDSPYEPPESPFLRIKTENKSVSACCNEIYDQILDEITLSEPPKA